MHRRASSYKNPKFQVLDVSAIMPLFCLRSALYNLYPIYVRLNLERTKRTFILQDIFFWFTLNVIFHINFIHFYKLLNTTIGKSFMPACPT